VTVRAIQVHHFEATPRPTSSQRFGGAALERGTIRGGDDPIAFPEQVNPLLQEVRRLRQHETRTAGLRIRERALEVVDAEHARPRRGTLRECRKNEGEGLRVECERRRVDLGGARGLASPIARTAENQLMHYCCAVVFGWFARNPVICFTA
jgi:hypothetical protein